MAVPGDFQGQSVLVTGGAGFIGSHLVEELVARGAQVVVVDNFSTGVPVNLAAVRDRIDLRLLDLRQDDLRPVLAERNFDILFHLAANANLAASAQNPRDDFEKNVLASVNVLEAVRDTSPTTRVIHTSSAAVYGEGMLMPIREDTPVAPVSPYGVSKLAAEHYVSVYAWVYGLRTANVRLFSVYGPRLRKQVVYDLLRKVHQNPDKLFIYGDGSQVRDFNHVANVVEALLVIAGQAELRGDIYNVAADETLSIGELARMICERMGAAPRFVYSGDVRPGESQRWQADISRLKGLGYRPRMALAAGLDNTVAWFRREAAVPASLA